MSLISCMLRMSSTFIQSKYSYCYNKRQIRCQKKSYSTQLDLVEIKLPKKVSALYLQDNFYVKYYILHVPQQNFSVLIQSSDVIVYQNRK
jgi:hypothetical protein